MYSVITSVSAKDSILSIYRNNPEVNQPFKVENMFPGDYITKKYQIDVSYTGEIIVYFTADVRPGYAKLAEVLMCKVVMPDEGKILYDGLMRDMPDKSHIMNAGSNGVTDRLNYEISVYLNTDVGNDYQKKDLIADFRWWAYTSDEGTPGTPGGSDDDGGGMGVIPPGTGTVKPSDKPDDGKTDADNPSDIPGGGDIKDPSDVSGEGEKPDLPGVSDKDEELDLPGISDKDEEPTSSDDATEKPQGSDKDEERPSGELIAPKTGDTFAPFFWILGILISAAVIFFIIIKRKNDDTEETVDTGSDITKKLSACIIIIIVLALCLCVTTFALVQSIVSVNENIFRTGEVKIELYNADKKMEPIIEDDEFLLEPGMRIVKDFYVKNNSTDPNGIWYKIYFDNVAGGLATVLDVKITDKKENLVLYKGKAINLTRDKTLASEFVSADEVWRELSVEFYYPKESGNKTKNSELTFEVVAEASQKANNTNKKFS